MYEIGDTVKIKKGAKKGTIFSKGIAFVYTIDETGLYISIRLKQPIDWKCKESIWAPIFHSKNCYTIRNLLIERKTCTK